MAETLREILAKKTDDALRLAREKIEQATRAKENERKAERRRWLNSYDDKVAEFQKQITAQVGTSRSFRYCLGHISDDRTYGLWGKMKPNTRALTIDGIKSDPLIHKFFKYCKSQKLLCSDGETFGCEVTLDDAYTEDYDGDGNSKQVRCPGYSLNIEVRW